MSIDFAELASQWLDDWRDQFEERAAIIEYDAGETRERAERIAFAMVAQLMKRAANDMALLRDVR